MQPQIGLCDGQVQGHTSKVVSMVIIDGERGTQLRLPPIFDNILEEHHRASTCTLCTLSSIRKARDARGPCSAVLHCCGRRVFAVEGRIQVAWRGDIPGSGGAQGLHGGDVDLVGDPVEGKEHQVFLQREEESASEFSCLPTNNGTAAGQLGAMAVVCCISPFGISPPHITARVCGN